MSSPPRSTSTRRGRRVGHAGRGARPYAVGELALSWLLSRPEVSTASAGASTVAQRPEQPIVRIVDANVYIRPDKGGLMLGGYEDEPRQFDGAVLPQTFQIAELELDLDVLRRLAGRVAQQFPIFQRVFEAGLIREHRGGLPTVTPDGRCCSAR